MLRRQRMATNCSPPMQSFCMPCHERSVDAGVVECVHGSERVRQCAAVWAGQSWTECAVRVGKQRRRCDDCVARPQLCTQWLQTRQRRGVRRGHVLVRGGCGLRRRGHVRVVRVRPERRVRVWSGVGGHQLQHRDDTAGATDTRHADVECDMRRSRAGERRVLSIRGGGQCDGCVL